VYDWHGIYGHPDHVQVHRVGHRAAELADIAQVFDVSFNRDVLAARMANAPAEMKFDPNDPMDDGNPMGTPEAELHLAVDVSDYVELKRTALACHASQVTDIGALLAMPPEIFALAFAVEWYTQDGAPPGVRSGWLFDTRHPEPAG
jgi:LmbE family N-acetylglucosaminyl deacetylase